MISLFDYFTLMGPRAPIYTHVCNDGTNFHIAVELMQRHNVEGVPFPMPPLREAAIHWKRRNIVSVERVAELAKRDPAKLGPVLLCEAPHGYQWELDLPDLQTSCCVADGHHRYCLAAFRRQTWIDAILYPHAVWQHFEITGVPDTTVDALEAEPITKRSY